MGILSTCRFLRSVRERNCFGAKLVTWVLKWAPAIDATCKFLPLRSSENHTLLGPQVLNLHGLGLLWRGSMQSSPADAGVVGPRATKSAGKRIVADAGALDSQGFPHDGA